MPVQYTAAKWLLFVALAVLVATGVAQRTVELATAPVDPDELLVQQFEQRHECVARTDGYLAAITSPSVDNPAPYSSSAFFDCWRSADEMDAFLSALAGLHPQFLTRLPSIAVSAELRDIPAYLLSVDANDTAAKDAVYLQGLSHAREWQSGGSVAFAAVSMLDGLLAGDVAILSAARSFDWFFVPVLNVDGYRYSFDRPETRFWRKNRRRVASARSGRVTVGVDLNRNFPVPFNATGAANTNGGPSSDTYAGPSALSEPETAGLDRWLRSLRLRGALDFHSFGGLVLRPPGSSDLLALAADAQDALGRIQQLGDAVRDAMPSPYQSRAACELYASTGSLMDALFFGRRDQTVAALTVELAGDAFVVDARTIRPVGTHALRAALAFAEGLPAFYAPSIN